MFTNIKKWWRRREMTERERYLSQASDLCDLERRLKNYEYNKARTWLYL
jgi:hypothetical protein